MKRNTVFTSLFLILALLILSLLAVPAAATPDSWTTKTPMPKGGVCGAAVVNGKIYAVFMSLDNPIYEYNPATDAWTLKSHVPTERNYFAVAAVQNKIYVIGGVIDEFGDHIVCGSNEAYNLATGSWETKASMPTNRSQIEANVVNGKIYIAGGRTARQYSTVNVTEVYDPVTDSWVPLSPMPYPVTSYFSAAVNDKIFVIGGQDEYLSVLNLNATQIFDPATDTWLLGSPAPEPLWQGAAAATTGVFAPKRIYVFGGMSGFAMGLNRTFVYDPEADSWNIGASMHTVRYNSAAAVVDDLIYVIGGGEGFSLLDVNEQYTPIGYSGSTTAPTAISTIQVSPSPTASASLTPSPSIQEFPLWATLLILATASVLVAVSKKVRR